MVSFVDVDEIVDNQSLTFHFIILQITDKVTNQHH